MLFLNYTFKENYTSFMYTRRFCDTFSLRENEYPSGVMKDPIPLQN